MSHTRTLGDAGVSTVVVLPRRVVTIMPERLRRTTKQLQHKGTQLRGDGVFHTTMSHSCESAKRFTSSQTAQLNVHVIAPRA